MEELYYQVRSVERTPKALRYILKLLSNGDGDGNGDGGGAQGGGGGEDGRESLPRLTADTELGAVGGQNF